MEEYRFGLNHELNIFYKPKECLLRIKKGRDEFLFSEAAPFFKAEIYGIARNIPFTSAKRVHIEEQRTPTSNGLRVIYESFYIGNLKLPISIDTLISLDLETGKIIFELELIGDEDSSILEVHWPQPIEFDDEDADAYTVVPMMQGVLIPSKWHNTVLLSDGKYYHHDGYMPWFGQRWRNKGYLIITRTAYDAGYFLDHIPCNKTRISNVWYPSLRKMRYRRVCEMTLFGECDYNIFCSCYRNYIKEKGEFRTLKEKVLTKPALESRIGVPLIQDYILASAEPSSNLYSSEHPEWNRHYYTFEQRLTQLKRLKAMGLERAQIHIDGFGQYGYDSGHPDIFPPHEDVGGISGMQSFIEECRKMNYSIDFHDQYRDFYRNSPSYCAQQAIEDFENNIPLSSENYGGNHSLLCAGYALSYIKRNYRILEENGLRPDGTHLASFSGGNIDECFNPAHRMSRRGCISYRREAFNYLSSKGYITCSDEPVDCLINSLDTVMHAPYSLTPVEWDGMCNGLPVPLFSIVYHDALIVPWFGYRKRGGWGIPNSDDALTHAILNASPVALEIDATRKEIMQALDCCKIAKQLAFVPVKRHDFISDNGRLQRMTYEDGTVIEADFDSHKTIIHK